MCAKISKSTHFCNFIFMNNRERNRTFAKKCEALGNFYNINETKHMLSRNGAVAFTFNLRVGFKGKKESACGHVA